MSINDHFWRDLLRKYMGTVRVYEGETYVYTTKDDPDYSAVEAKTLRALERAVIVKMDRELAKATRWLVCGRCSGFAPLVEELTPADVGTHTCPECGQEYLIVNVSVSTVGMKQVLRPYGPGAYKVSLIKAEENHE